MKCKICGHRTAGKNALKNMGKHYRKKHPDKMKRKPKAAYDFRKAVKTKSILRTSELYYKLSEADKEYLIFTYVPYGALVKLVRGY